MDSIKDLQIMNGIFLYSTCAFDKEQAINFFREKYKNDPDIQKVRITRIQSSLIKNSIEKLYLIFFRLDSSPIMDKPLCEECGSNRVISRGKEWYCRTCGHYWSKIKRNRNL